MKLFISQWYSSHDNSITNSQKGYNEQNDILINVHNEITCITLYLAYILISGRYLYPTDISQSRILSMKL
jgi:hypothetical protein